MSNQTTSPYALWALFSQPNFNAALGMRPRHWVHLASAVTLYGEGHELLKRIPDEYRSMANTHVRVLRERGKYPIAPCPYAVKAGGPKR